MVKKHTKYISVKLSEGMTKEIDTHLKKNKQFNTRVEYIRFLVMKDLENIKGRL